MDLMHLRFNYSLMCNLRLALPLFFDPGVSEQYYSSKMSRKGLMEQDLSKLDVTKLHPLSPEVISRQATINIGLFPKLTGSFATHYLFQAHPVLF